MTKKLSYVWDYFQIKDGYAICKIVILLKGEEVECQKSYKYDGGTGNMKQHLLMKHEISSPDDSQAKSSEKSQLCIDEMVKKVTPHHASKQAKLKQITAEWFSAIQCCLWKRLSKNDAAI